jgi:hypothetical protein
MTIRELISGRKRKASIVAYGGFALSALGVDSERDEKMG